MNAMRNADLDSSGEAELRGAFITALVYVCVVFIPALMVCCMVVKCRRKSCCLKTWVLIQLFFEFGTALACIILAIIADTRFKNYSEEIKKI